MCSKKASASGRPLQAGSGGLRRVAHDTLDVDEGAVEIKCGWFGGARAHAVAMVECDGRIVGTVATTTSSPTADELATMRNATGDDNKLAAAHDALVGEHVRDAVCALLGTFDAIAPERRFRERVRLRRL